jgi:tetratricopeptide (TPR) repeat protein
MNLTSSFLLYLAVFRVAVIAAGVVCIVLGYKLFAHKAAGSNSTSVQSRWGKFAFAMKNAAPGTCFALFGACLIGANFWQGGPTLTLKTLSQVESASTRAGSNSPVVHELIMKGAGPTIRDLTEEGKQCELQADREGAKKAYAEALYLLGEPMNNLASLYLKEGRTNEALQLARSAVILLPDKPGILHTFGTALNSCGNRDEALRQLGRAARLDARYEKELEKLQAREP